MSRLIHSPSQIVSLLQRRRMMGYGTGPGGPQEPLFLTGYGLGGGGTNLGPYYYVSSYELVWTAQPGATDYEVHEAINPPPFGAGTFSLRATTASLTYSRDTLAEWSSPPQPYFSFKIIALSGLQESNVLSGLAALPSPPPTYNYFRPGGVDTYLRFGTADTYIRP